MRFWGRVVAVLAVAGCSGSVPNADHITGQNVPILASSVASDAAGWHDRVDGDPRQQE